MTSPVVLRILYEIDDARSIVDIAAIRDRSNAYAPNSLGIVTPLILERIDAGDHTSGAVCEEEERQTGLA